MKVCIFIVEGDTQLVLSPENEFEKFALRRLTEGNHLEIAKGKFVKSTDGWHTFHPYEERYAHGYNDDSYMVRVEQRDCVPDTGEGQGNSVDPDWVGESGG